MAMQLRKAERKQAKIRIAISGPSGSGKTMSALYLAYGITHDWSKIALIDSERGSGDLYSDMGEYNILPLDAPYTPERYIEAINACEQSGMEVIIIDSTTHEWDGKGGILEISDSMTGNSFTNWGKITPRHNKFVDAMINSKCHLIATLRSKQDYVLVEKNGKQVPEKVGLKAITREGLEYEFTLVFDIDIKHHAKSTKDRTRLFMDKPEFVITPETGEKVVAWANDGTVPPAQKVQISDKALKDALGRVGEAGFVDKLRGRYELSPAQEQLLQKEIDQWAEFGKMMETHVVYTDLQDAWEKHPEWHGKPDFSSVWFKRMQELKKKE